MASLATDGPLDVVARRSRDAGFEVVLLGAGQTPHQIARAAVAEDVQAIVLLPGDELGTVRAVLEELDASDIEVRAG